MFIILKKGHQPGVYVPLRALFLVLMAAPRKLSFLAHLSQWLIGELIGYSWSGVRPSAASVRRKQFQTSSPKPLGRSKPNFMWSLLG